MAAWGVRMDDTLIIADRARAQRVAAGRDARRALVDYILWMALSDAEMAQDDLITANIDRLNLGTVGAFEPVSGARTTFMPLVTSSADATLMARDYVLSAPTPDDLQRRFEPGAAPYTIAARLTGPVASIFPTARPMPKRKRANARADDHVPETDAANIVVFADSDFFDDRFWVSEQNYLGQRFGVPIADNGKFLLNAVENMMGSSDLISLRGRERIARPFTRVEALRRAAKRNIWLKKKISWRVLKWLKTSLTASSAKAHSLAMPNAPHGNIASNWWRAQSLRDVQGNLRRH